MIIAANWKAYIEDAAKARKLFALAKRAVRMTNHIIILAPSAPFLGLLSANNHSDVVFAAQDVSATTGGAKTGESTAAAYAAAGATYAIVGHSERRAAGDTNELVTEKMMRALAHGLTPILCIGERVRDHDGHYLSFIREELTTTLSKIDPKETSSIIVAYEPVWAIGKTAGSALVPSDLVEMTLYIRKVLAEIMPQKSAEYAQILYGGSVEPENIRDLAASTSIDGFLIGHASVDIQSFSALVRAVA